jgi:Flp pilus assembly protein TadG
MESRFKKGSKGQAVVETALILPIILLILMGIIDFGLLFNNYLIIANASREAARQAAVGVPDGNIYMSISKMTATVDPYKMRPTIYPPPASRKKGAEITVTIEYDNVLITPVISAIIPNPVKLTATTVMRIE